MSTVLIVAIVFASVVAMQWIKMVGKEREEDRQISAGGSVGLRELEERMQAAVSSAIQPLREQVAALEDRMSRLGPERQLTEGEAEARTPGEREEVEDRR